MGNLALLSPNRRPLSDAGPAEMRVRLANARTELAHVDAARWLAISEMNEARAEAERWRALAVRRWLHWAIAGLVAGMVLGIEVGLLLGQAADWLAAAGAWR